MPRGSLADRLWSKIDQSGGPTACWPWTAARNRRDDRAYGVIGRGGRNEGLALAHRVAYELAVGPIPDGYDIDHLCRYRLCCNPVHLEAVTHAENVRRSNHPSAIARREQRCRRGHPYEGNRYRTPSGLEYCHPCIRERTKGQRVAITEAQWMQTVRELARALGWLEYHTHDSRRSTAGFPDLVLVRERVVYVELKSSIGKLTPDQEAWLAALRSTGAETYVWRPADYEAAVETLKRRSA